MANFGKYINGANIDDYRSQGETPQPMRRKRLGEHLGGGTGPAWIGPHANGGITPDDIMGGQESTPPLSLEDLKLIQQLGYSGGVTPLQTNETPTVGPDAIKSNLRRYFGLAGPGEPGLPSWMPLPPSWLPLKE